MRAPWRLLAHSVSRPMLTPRGEQQRADGGSHGVWLAVDWDGRASTTRGTPVWEQRTPGQDHLIHWQWDGARLTLTTGRLGMLPLYYWSHERGIAVATSISQLLRLGAPPALDWDALGVFLQIGWYQGETTPFAAIRVAPPGSSSWWQDGRLHLSGGPCVAPPGAAIGQSEAIATYTRLFAEAIEETAPGSRPTILPLSGGRDSRHILLELARVGAPPRACLTYAPSRDHPEWRAARILTTHVGVEHRFIPLPSYTPELDRRKSLMADFGTDEHLHYVTLADAVARMRDEIGGAPELYDGIAGDILSAGLFLAPDKIETAARGDWRRLARQVMAPLDNRRVLHPDVAARVPPLTSTVDRIAAELERHAGAANPLSSYYFWNRTRREIALAPLRMFAAVIPVQTPFLHPPLFDWLAQLPTSVVQDHALHTATIRAAYPRAADVPYADAFTWKPPCAPSWATIAGLARDGVRERVGSDGANPLRLRHTILVPWFAAGRLHPRHAWAARYWLRRVYYLRSLGAVLASDFAGQAGSSASDPSPTAASVG